MFIYIKKSLRIDRDESVENVRVYKELVEKYLASRAILISTEHNESNIIIGRSLRHNETIRVRLTASSSLLRLSVLPLSLRKIPLRSCNLLFKAVICSVKKKKKPNRYFVNYCLSLNLILIRTSTQVL